MFAIPDLAVFATLATPLLVTLWTDLRSRLVYPLVLLPGLLAAFAIAATGPLGWPAALLGGAGAAGVTALLVVLACWLWPDATEAPLGSGDVLIAALIGTMFGPRQAPAVLFMGATAGAVAAGGLLLTRRAQRGDVIPYGVFLCGAALVALVLNSGPSGALSPATPRYSLTPSPSPVEPGEGSLTSRVGSTSKLVSTSTHPSPSALGEGLGVRVFAGEEPVGERQSPS